MKNIFLKISFIFFLPISLLFLIEFISKIFVDAKMNETVYAYVPTKPLAFKNDNTFETIKKQFDGSCKNKISKIIYDGNFPTYDSNWSCGGATFENGTRLTLPRVEINSDTNKILMFGGSTLWSPGVTDHNTIPSMIQKELQFKNFVVLNYGFSTVVAKQQANKLKTTKLKKNDIVVFYDGFNDFWQSSMLGNPNGTIIGYNQKNKISAYIVNIKFWLSNNSSFYNLLAQIKNNKKDKYSLKKCTVSSELATRNAKKFWKVYVENLNEARKYTLKNEAKFLHILHPNLFSHRDLTNYEKGLRKLRACYSEAQDAYELYYSKVRKFLKNQPWHIDLSKELKRQNFYFDHAHLSAKGNQILSLKIIQNQKFQKAIQK